MSVSPACMSAIMCMPGTLRGQKEVSDPLELTLQTVVSSHISAKKQILSPLQELQAPLTTETSLQCGHPRVLMMNVA